MYFLGFPIFFSFFPPFSLYPSLPTPTHSTFANDDEVDSVNVPRLLLNQLRWLDRVVDPQEFVSQLFDMVQVTPRNIQHEVGVGVVVFVSGYLWVFCVCVCVCVCVVQYFCTKGFVNVCLCVCGEDVTLSKGVVAHNSFFCRCVRKRISVSFYFIIIIIIFVT